MMQPTDHRSDCGPQPHSRITSGARYCRVFIIFVWWSFSKVAPPKSINFMSEYFDLRNKDLCSCGSAEVEGEDDRRKAAYFSEGNLS